MVASDSFAEFLREQLAPLGRVTMRRMFGKTGVFCDGLMLGMVTENTLYFRVDDHNRAAFDEAASFPPLNYEKKGNTIDLSFGARPNGCSTSPMSFSTGREQRWPRRVGSRRREAGKRPGESQRWSGNFDGCPGGARRGGALSAIWSRQTLNPNSAHAWIARGSVSISQSRPDAAVEALEHAIRLNPLDPWGAQAFTF
jgi:DNA transformation protein